MEQFYEDLKTALDITWEDAETHAKLIGILTRGAAELSEYAGTTLDFQAHPAELQLLLDLCRYIYNNASEDFETNFRSKLISLRARYQVEAMEDVADG